MPKDKPKDFKEKRTYDLLDQGWDIDKNPQDYHYMEFKNPVTKKVDRDFYHIPTLKKVGELAQKRGIDPWTAMQIAASETHGGMLGGGKMNPMHRSGGWDKWVESYLTPVMKNLEEDAKGAESRTRILDDMVSKENKGKVQAIWDKNLPREEDVENKEWDEQQSANIHAGLNQMEYAINKYGKNLTGVQAYSGTKKRPSDEYMKEQGYKRAFGQTKERMDMWKEKPQGRKVLALEPYLKQIPALKEAFPEDNH